MSANECKQQQVKFLFSYDGRAWELAEVEGSDSQTQMSSQTNFNCKVDPVNRYGWRDFKTDVGVAATEAGDVILCGTSAIIRMLPAVIRVTGRIIQGAGYLIYWTAYGCIVIVASLISAFSIPVIREHPREHPPRTDGCSDVNVNVNVEVNINR